MLIHWKTLHAFLSLVISNMMLHIWHNLDRPTGNSHSLFHTYTRRECIVHMHFLLNYTNALTMPIKVIPHWEGGGECGWPHEWRGGSFIMCRVTQHCITINVVINEVAVRAIKSYIAMFCCYLGGKYQHSRKHSLLHPVSDDATVEFCRTIKH